MILPLAGMMQPRHPFRVASAVMVAALLATTAGVAAEPAGTGAPAGALRPKVPTNERAALRAERAVGELLARLDEDLSLDTFPEATPRWLARLAASIESRGDDEPAQALLRNLAVELRGLGVEWSLGGSPDQRPDGRPTAASPLGRERAERIGRIRELVELVNRKLGLADDPRPAERRSGPAAIGPKYGSDSCTSAPPLVLGDTDYGSTYGATIDGGASCGGPTPSPDVWYTFTAPEDGTYTFETVDDGYSSTFDTVLSLHAGCTLPGGDTQELACNDDTGATLLSSISYPLTQGQLVGVRVSGYGGAVGQYDLRVQLDRTVSGTVTREATGAPIAGATVEVLNYYEHVVATATTGADGTYTAGVAAAPELYGRVRHDSFITELYDDYQCEFASYCDTYYADAFSVSSADASGIDFALQPAGSISGTVVGADTGEAPAGTVYVDVYDDSGAFVGSISGPHPDGEFELSSLLPGSYYLLASSSGYQPEAWPDVACPYPCDVTTGTPIVVPAETAVTGIDFVLDRLGRVQGQVTRTDSGAPISSALVYVYDDTGSYASSTYTGNEGSYEVSRLAEGTYFARTFTTAYLDELYDDLPCEPDCTVTSGTSLDVHVNTPLTGVDFSLVPKASISGTVEDADTSEPLDLYVELYDQAGNYVDSEPTYYDPLGAYEFRGLDAGTYYLWAGSSSYYATHEAELYDDIPCEPTCDVTAGTPVVVAATAQVTGIDFALDRRGSISGTVVDATSGLTLYDVHVVAYRLDGTSVASAYTQGDGSYEIQNVPAGSYRVGTNAEYHRDEMYDDVPCGSPCDRTTGATVAVQSKTETAGVHFALSRLGSISGSVVNHSTGAGLDSHVYLLDGAGQVVRSDFAYGGYQIHGIDPGTYYLLAREDSYEGTFQDELYPDVPCEPDCDLTDGTPIVVGLESVLTGYHFSLAPCPVGSRAEVSSTTLSTSYKALACELVSASDLLLSPGADVLLKSGRTVVLGDGFEMEDGARLRVVIEPAWSGEDD